MRSVVPALNSSARPSKSRGSRPQNGPAVTRAAEEQRPSRAGNGARSSWIGAREPSDLEVTLSKPYTEHMACASLCARNLEHPVLCCAVRAESFVHMVHHPCPWIQIATRFNPHTLCPPLANRLFYRAPAEFVAEDHNGEIDGSALPEGGLEATWFYSPVRQTRSFFGTYDNLSKGRNPGLVSCQEPARGMVKQEKKKPRRRRQSHGRLAPKWHHKSSQCVA